MNISVNPAPGFRDHPEHTVSTVPFEGVVVVTFGDAVVASTEQALLLAEVNHAPVFYIPFEDIYFEFLTASETHSYCPYKGDASYWNISASGDAMRDVIWAYRSPFDELLAIKGHGAFYPDKVGIEATPHGDGTSEL